MSVIEENVGKAMKKIAKQGLRTSIKVFDHEGQINMLRLWKLAADEMLDEMLAPTNVTAKYSIDISEADISVEDVKKAIKSALKNA